jgi:hypothetical protein
MAHKEFKKLENKEEKAIKKIAEGVKELQMVEKKEKILVKKYKKMHKEMHK